MSQPFHPRDYQRAIVTFLMSHDRCNIWAGMGTGKTVSTLTALQGLELLTDPFPALVIAPRRVATTTWPGEEAKWAHLAGVQLRSIAGSRQFNGHVADIDCVNYDNLVELVEHWGDRWPYRTVIADESTRLKSFRLTQGGKRARALARVAHKHVGRWVNLTGAPAPNGIVDLWGQQWFVDGGSRLGKSFTAFTNRWFTVDRPPGQAWGGRMILRPGAREQIEGRLRDCTITINAADYFDLPPLIENIIRVDLPADARRHYSELQRDLFTKLRCGAEKEVANAATLSMACLQAAAGALYTDDKGTWREIHDVKLDALASVVEEANGAPVLCAYHFRSDLARILRAFPQAVHLSDERSIADFSAGRISLGVAHPASMGHGIDGLQNHCSIGVFFTSGWSLENHVQIIERIGPTRQAQIGRTNGVTWHSIVARDTVDELVVHRLATKASVQEILMQAMKEKQ